MGILEVRATFLLCACLAGKLITTYVLPLISAALQIAGIDQFLRGARHEWGLTLTAWGWERPAPTAALLVV